MTAEVDTATLKVRCQIHALKRGLERGIDLDCAKVARLEDMLARMAPAYRRPDRSRYWVTAIVEGQRIRVLYDARLGCMVTVWR